MSKMFIEISEKTTEELKELLQCKNSNISIQTIELIKAELIDREYELTGISNLEDLYE